MNTFGELKKIWPLAHEWILLEEMDRNFFPRPWTLGQWQGLSETMHLLFYWQKASTPIGFALFSHVPSDDMAHLLKICILPEYRGSGEASLFWKQLVSALRTSEVEKIYLEVEESNKIAQNFYKKLGFLPLRTVKGFYSDGQAAITMLLTLGDQGV
jgi:ribosomal-protein-alanine N-acetyltransferase